MSDVSSAARTAVLVAQRRMAEAMLEHAAEQARMSPCSKSKRGVVVWSCHTGLVLSRGFNHPPEPFRCDGSEACRAACGKRCVHAEQAALLDLGDRVVGMHMLHVKVVDGQPVPGGPPSCSQCSKLILAAGIEAMWLYEHGPQIQLDGTRAGVLVPYHADDFHALSLLNEGL